MKKITVTLETYSVDQVPLASGGTFPKRRLAFMVRFPDGTGAWSHNRANVRALAREYNRAHGKFVAALAWDSSCGTYDPGRAVNTDRTPPTRRQPSGCWSRW